MSGTKKPLAHGSGAGETAPGDLPAALRVRREQLGWSQSELARVSGVSRTVVNEVEMGRRRPSLSTYDKLRRALGLDLPAVLALLPTSVPPAASEQFLTSLAALLLTSGRIDLPQVARAAGVTTTKVRTAVAELAERLSAVGLAAVDDGVSVELVVLPHAGTLLEQVRDLDEPVTLTPEALMVLVIIGHLGEATRRQIDERRGTDSASVVDRLAALDLVERRTDNASLGRPNAYRLTARVLTVLGHGTLESFQAWCRHQVAAAQQDDAAPAAPLPHPNSAGSGSPNPEYAPLVGPPSSATTQTGRARTPSPMRPSGPGSS